MVTAGLTSTLLDPDLPLRKALAVTPSHSRGAVLICFESIDYCTYARDYQSIESKGHKIAYSSMYLQHDGLLASHGMLAATSDKRNFQSHHRNSLASRPAIPTD